MKLAAPTKPSSPQLPLATPSYCLKAELQPAMSLEDFPGGLGWGKTGNKA